MKACLFTGFTSFLNYSSNPTEELARQMHSRILGDYKITSKILPVDYANAEQLLGPIENYQLIILNGLAVGRNFISFETLAHNQIDSPQADAQGCTIQNQVIYPNAMSTLTSSFPLTQLSSLLENLVGLGHPVQLSCDPGRYLCNYIYYKTLFALGQKSLPIPCLFIHWPAHQKLDPASPFTVGKYLEIISDFFSLLMPLP
ncbi:MAG: hypothetical protein AABY86_09725 [Bdellovibrionota bacterium]